MGDLALEAPQDVRLLADEALAAALLGLAALGLLPSPLCQHLELLRGHRQAASVPARLAHRVILLADLSSGSRLPESWRAPQRRALARSHEVLDHRIAETRQPRPGAARRPTNASSGPTARAEERHHLRGHRRPASGGRLGRGLVRRVIAAEQAADAEPEGTEAPEGGGSADSHLRRIHPVEAGVDLLRLGAGDDLARLGVVEPLILAGRGHIPWSRVEVTISGREWLTAEIAEVGVQVAPTELAVIHHPTREVVRGDVPPVGQAARIEDVSHQSNPPPVTNFWYLSASNANGMLSRPTP